MSNESIIIILILGAIAGWLGGVIFKGSGVGLIGNIIIGIVGGFIGHWVFGKLGIHMGTGYLSYILTAGIGAAILLALLNLVFGGRR
ncbi:MAG: GlsB/YeaQ/YmgE family stress response membrane protein [Aquabacterium sp.]|nr:GlsB/YeaQ/YmgE family stress response membrane protein [Ferruginibacter sp.]